MASVAGTLLEAERSARATLQMDEETPRTEEEVRRSLRRLIGSGAVKHPDHAAHATIDEVQAFHGAAGAVKFLSELYGKLAAMEARKAARAASSASAKKPGTKASPKPSRPHYAATSAPAARRAPPSPPPPIIPPHVDPATRQFLQQFHATGALPAPPPTPSPQVDSASLAAIQSGLASASRSVQDANTRATAMPQRVDVVALAPVVAIPASVDPETRRFLQDFLTRSAP